MEKIRTVGTFTEVFEFEKLTEGITTSTFRSKEKEEPKLNLIDYDEIMNGRKFTRWYRRNKKMVDSLAIVAPSFALLLFGVKKAFLTLLIPPMVIPVASVGASFAGTHGIILLHMLIIGFLTLVVSTFLKFTGRGDLIPLIAFVGGGAILYEVLGMFKDIYTAVAGFLKM